MGIMGTKDSDMTDWQKQRSERSARLKAGSHYASGKMVPPDQAKAFLEAVIRPGDRVRLEGDNQKQADFLAEALADVDRSRIHDLHIVQSGIVLQAHLDLFERGIARKLDFSYSGPQGAALARALAGGKIELGAIHTYIELFARYFMDEQAASLPLMEFDCNFNNIRVRSFVLNGAPLPSTLSRPKPAAFPPQGVRLRRAKFPN
jgi:hypothetical protein